MQINFFPLQRENWKTNASKQFTTIIPCTDSNLKQYQRLFETLFRPSKRLNFWNSIFSKFPKFPRFQSFEGCIRCMFPSLFCNFKGKHWWNSEKYIFFYFKSSLRSWNNQILDFQIFKLLMFWFSSIIIYYKWNNHWS